MFLRQWFSRCFSHRLVRREENDIHYQSFNRFHEYKAVPEADEDLIKIEVQVAQEEPIVSPVKIEYEPEKVVLRLHQTQASIFARLSEEQSQFERWDRGNGIYAGACFWVAILVELSALITYFATRQYTDDGHGGFNATYDSDTVKGLAIAAPIVGISAALLCKLLRYYANKDNLSNNINLQLVQQQDLSILNEIKMALPEHKSDFNLLTVSGFEKEAKRTKDDYFNYFHFVRAELTSKFGGSDILAKLTLSFMIPRVCL